MTAPVQETALTVSERATAHLAGLEPELARAILDQAEAVPIGSGATIVEIRIAGQTFRLILHPDGEGRRLMACPRIAGEWPS